MMLPFYLDLIPELIGKGLSRLFGWIPTGKRVKISLEDNCSDVAMCGTVARGTIYRVIDNFITRGPTGFTKHSGAYAIIKLDAPLREKGQNIIWLITFPRVKGHGLYRLFMTWSAVTIMKHDSPEPPQELLSDNVIAIGIMKTIGEPRGT